MNRKSPIIIGIAGGTGSGKSTFTNRLKDAFGDQVTVLYHDNYYRAHDDMPFEQRKKLNYDHPDAFETELLLEHLNKLKNWEAIDCPTYNYANHNRAEATIHIEPRPVILLEGILVLYDEALRNLLDIRIFVDADADERILRRILRDTKERGRDIENIIDQYLTTVKPMHALFVEPTRAYADVVTNSGRNEVAFSLVRGGRLHGCWRRRKQRNNISKYRGHLDHASRSRFLFSTPLPPPTIHTMSASHAIPSSLSLMPPRLLSCPGESHGS